MSDRGCAQIRAACLEIEAGYCPDITFIIVRNGTRLYPVGPGAADPKSQNVYPGRLAA